MFGAALLLPALATRLTRPLTTLADRFMAHSQSDGALGQIGSSLLLGAATGLLWAPCAGPILGLILTGAALHGATWATAAALTAYALGAASSLAVVSGLGKQALDGLKRSLGLGERVRRAMGALVLLSVTAIGFGFDTRALAHVPSTSTTGVESRLVGLLSANSSQKPRIQRISAKVPSALPVEGRLPSLDGAESWLNSPPLTAAGLRGKVEDALQAIADILGVPQEDRHKMFDWSNRMVGANDPEYGVTEENAADAANVHHRAKPPDTGYFRTRGSRPPWVLPYPDPQIGSMVTRVGEPPRGPRA